MKAKQSSSNVKKPALIMGIAFIALGCTLGISSFAWFLLPSSTKGVSGMDGEATGSYFSIVNGDKADGTKDHPFGIQNAQQLYYFNWLQDLGYFNKDEDKDGKIDQQYYFVLMNDIDASEKVLPPAGTTEYPFVGNFDGQGHKISGLTISNSWGSLKNKPSTAKSTDNKEVTLNNAEIVGFFGVVGEYDGDADVSGYTISVNEVKDLYFDDLKIETASSSTLVGLIAGYANGQLTNCGVRKGYFDFQYKDSDGKLTAPSVINSGALAGNDKLSQYSLIGAYNSYHFKYDGKPSGSDDDTSGSWGGSIDIASLAKRVNYIAAAGGMTAKSSTTTKFDMTERFAANLYYQGTTFSWDSYKETGQRVYFMNGTCLPLNIDLEKATISDSYIGTASIGTYYTSGSNTGEPVSDSNTGYLVGRGGDGTISESNATPRLYNKGMNLVDTTSTGSKKNGIRYSIYAWDHNDSSISDADKTKDANGIYPVFGYDNLSFFYIDTLASNLDTATYRITDTENSSKSWSTTKTSNTKDVADCGFGDTTNGYYKVKHNFAKMLSDGNTTSNLSSGVASLDAIQLYKIGSSDITKYGAMEKGTYSNIKINGITYDSYEMYKAGFNFELSSSGSLKMILGTYTSSTSTSGHVMPSVYEIIRSEDKKSITTDGAKKISAIYKLDGKYYNQYTDNSATIPSGAQKVFDLNVLYTTNASSSTVGYLKHGCAYYMEIPLSAGDYFIGADSIASNCPFIMYFDIGANGEDGKKDSGEQVIPPIDFVYYSDVGKETIKRIDSTKTATDSSSAQTEVSDYTPSKTTFAISGSPTTVYFYRVVSSTTADGTTTETIKLYYIDSNRTATTDGNVSVTGNASKGKSYKDETPEDTTSGGAS